MTTRPLIATLGLALALSSCNPEVQFDGPMPPNRMNLPNIPGAFRGTIADDDVDYVIGKDTVLLGDEVLVNGEDFLLRKMAGHLVFSRPVVETGHWEVLVFKKEDGAFTMGEMKGHDESLARVQVMLERGMNQKRSEGTPGYKYTLVSPTAKEFKAMLQEGLFDFSGEPCPLPKGGLVRPSTGILPSN